ncbi:MAG: AsnC family transcriptional regulator, partial [Thermoplasmata archaeon]|nr:AsnC family transcriptional regulator [Thermoplasmata archaeon]NIS14028.1 AsnC family transcriptional regulator [Thermoplasmata archaeon]NIS21861.1 AsnC family transcriptional regulator [Thermoplasmata archaeon]NIT79467.1 AsnC family transcriptional regulator [Thermoplasmata archaeon]NIU50896.1 AsnC family transcriptional regulator [Thermoplasmata archaeon]
MVEETLKYHPPLYYIDRLSGWEHLRHMDEVDQSILRILLKDASVSQETIAHEVGTSVGT